MWSSSSSDFHLVLAFKYMHRDSLAAIPQIHSFLNFYTVVSPQGHRYVCTPSLPPPSLFLSPHSVAVGQRHEQQTAHIIPGPSHHPWPLMHHFNDIAATYTVLLKFLH